MYHRCADNQSMRRIPLVTLLTWALLFAGGCLYNNREEPYYPAALPVHEAAILPFQVTVLHPGGDPIVGARVSVQTEPLYWAADTMQTDSHGRVRVGVLQGKRLTVNVMAEGYEIWTLTLTKKSALPEELIVHPLPDPMARGNPGSWIP